MQPLALQSDSLYSGLMGAHSTYAQTLLGQMESDDNPQGRPVTIRELSQAAGRSYELCRVILRGRPIVSREFNEAACRYLGLDEPELWRLAVLEKARRRFGATERQITVPPDPRLERAWSRLGKGNRETVIRIAEKLASQAGKRQSADDEKFTIFIVD